MEKYQIMREVGRGSFGVVWHAINLHTRKQVAIKKLKTQNYCSYDYSEAKLIMKEVKSLINMNNHPNIVKLMEVVKENDTVFLVFEYMQGGSLFNRMARNKQPFSEIQIKNICFQIFQGLAYMHHKAGYFHRDLKPENLLVYNDVVKIADLGSARETDDQSPYTYNVTTLWYRAPEVFLHAPCYDSAVDMWAMGAIMAELFTFRPLFQGDSEAEVMWKICRVLGTPTESTWFDGVEFARNMYYRFPEFPKGMRFCDVLPSSASLDAVNLIGSLLSWKPSCRPTALEALQHPFFYECYPMTTIHLMKETLMTEILMQRQMELLRQLMKEEEDSTSNGGIKYCSEAGVDDPNEDPIRMLPESPFDFM